MASDLIDFLARLATEPETFTAFVLEADELMAEQGLADDARAALLGGDPLAIHLQVTGGGGEVEPTPPGAGQAEAGPAAQSPGAAEVAAAWQQYHQMYLYWLSMNPAGADPSSPAAPLAAPPTASDAPTHGTSPGNTAESRPPADSGEPSGTC